MKKDFYFYLRCKIWYVQFRGGDGARSTAKSTGQTDRKEAEKWARRARCITDFVDGYESRLVELATRITQLEERINSLEHKVPQKIKAEKAKGYIYFIVIKREDNYLVKIGKGARKKRAHEHSLPFDAEYLYIQTNERHQEETDWHKHFASKHVRREWFALNENDLNQIRQWAGDEGSINDFVEETKDFKTRTQDDGAS